ncbi:MAG: DUF6916 family protein [Bacillota bacterium]
MLQQLDLPHFLEQLHTPFQVASASVAVELTEVNALGSTPHQRRFSLLFQGPLDRFLPQGIYALRHDQLGEFDLFLVPVGRQPEGFLYEAVFNRLVEP